MIRSTWAMPILIALFTLGGLLLALTGDGARDLLAGLALGAPVFAAAWAMRARRS